MNSEACIYDSECQLNCEHIGLCDLKIRKCSCLPLFEPLPSNDAKCSKDSDCAKPCGRGCKRYDCVRGYCMCHCNAWKTYCFLLKAPILGLPIICTKRLMDKKSVERINLLFDMLKMTWLILKNIDDNLIIKIMLSI